MPGGEIMKRKVVAVMPIKLNNQRFQGKNTKPFDDGTPMLQSMLGTLLKISCIDEVYVYCSTPSIISYLPEEVNFLQRSPQWDTDSTTFQDWMTSFSSDVSADIYVLAHATSPFVRQQSIEKCVLSVLSGEYDSAFTAKLLQDFLWKDGTPLNFDPANTPRTQDLEAIYAESFGCYVFTKSLFDNTKRRIGSVPYICEVDKIECIDVDYPDDFTIANAVYMNIINGKANKG
jgi:CMP-N-acetylneuraminic acid synthetase